MSNLYTTNFLANINGVYQDLGNIFYNWTSNTVNIPVLGTTLKKYSINYKKPTIVLESDITASLNGYSLYGDQVFTFGPMQSNKYVVGNTPPVGGNIFSYSSDGLNYYGINTSTLFTPNNIISVNTIKYNGSIWVAGTNGVNTMAYSYNGITWVGLGNTIFSTGCYDIQWNGRIWVATGMTANTLAYSYDGINWIGSGNTVVSNQTVNNKITWNGLVFLMTTQFTRIGSGNIISAVSYNGINWERVFDTTAQTLGAYIFNGTTSLNQPLWDGKRWVVGGSFPTLTGNILWNTDDANGKTQFISAGYINNESSSQVLNLYHNGFIYISGTTGATGNTLAYSYLHTGTIPNVTGSNPTQTTTTWNNWSRVFVGQTAGQTIKWDGQKFLATFKNTTSGNNIAYSLNGTTWIGLGSTTSLTSNTIEYNSVRPHSITFQRNLTIATGAGGNTLAYSLNGISWTGLGNSVFTTEGRCSAYNGKIWVAGGAGGNTLAYSYDGYKWTGLGSYVFSTTCQSVAWNNKMCVAVGRGGNTVAYSYDGLTWLTSSSSNVLFTATDISSQSVCWNGKIWVIGGGNTGGNTIAYSTDGINWTGLKFTGSVPCIATNGQMFITGNVDGPCLYSYDGISWATNASTVLRTMRSIYFGGTSFLATGTTTTNTMGMVYSNDGRNWTNLSTVNTLTGSIGYGLTLNGIVYIQTGFAGNSTIYSVDGTAWTITNTTLLSLYPYSYKTIFSTAGYGVSSNYNVKPKAYIQHPTIAFGSGTINTMAYSPDGINWSGLGSTVFSSQGRKAFWNGQRWIAGGSGGNTLAYSYDGYNWTGLGSSVITSQVNGITYNGSIWVSTGQGGNTIAYSINGYEWKPVTNSSNIFTTSGYGITWNGTIFLATGRGGNNIATSTDGITWSGITNTNSATNGNVYSATNGIIWVVPVPTSIGLMYTFDKTGQSGWTNVTSSPFSVGGSCVAWNGAIWVAGGSGSNQIAYSTNGTTWTGVSTSFPSVSDIYWNGVRFVATGGTYMGYSADGITWYVNNMTNIFSVGGYGLASNSGIGAFVAPSAMVLDNNGINGVGMTASQTLELISSDPYYQQGFSNVSVKIETNNIY